MLRKLYILLVVLSASTSLLAQVAVKGLVTDARTGAPISNVSVSIKGSLLGTATQPDGSYKITVPAGYTALVFSGTGYSTQEAGIAELVDIKLEPASAVSLDEVIVVGYGTKTKRDVTSSIARVTADEFKDQPVSTVEQALQGRAAGVFINAGSGKLGQGLKLRVRGISSISADQQPYVVIDGVPVTNQPLSSSDEPDNPLASINPDDIESIEVLKDASSAAIYGARASNGVLFATQDMGRGSFVYLTDNVMFRNFWENGKLMLVNAVFLVGN